MTKACSLDHDGGVSFRTPSFSRLGDSRFRDSAAHGPFGVCKLERMRTTPEEPEVNEVYELWRMFKDFQKHQADKFSDLENEVVGLRKEVVSLQELKVTDALDYAEAEVQDVRASLEKVAERQESDAAKFQQSQEILLGGAVTLEALRAQVEGLETKLVADLETKLLSEVARVARKESEQECAFQLLQSKVERQDLDSSQVQQNQEMLRQQIQILQGSCSDRLGEARTIEALRTQVDMLETKLVADIETKLHSEVARVAQKESDQERAFQILQSRIDMWDKQGQCLNAADDCSSDSFQDLQAVVERQLLEETTDLGMVDLQTRTSDPLQDLQAVVKRQLLEETTTLGMIGLHTVDSTRVAPALAC